MSRVVARPVAAQPAALANGPVQVPVATGAAGLLTVGALVLADVTSVMDLGLVQGALLGAGLAGRCAPRRHIPARRVAAAVLGGLLLGYGSRIAYGCNIGALFGGIASTSLHGWLWAAAALAGTPLGVRLRGLFWAEGARPPA